MDDEINQVATKSVAERARAMADKIGGIKGLLYILLFASLVFIPLILVYKDLKSKITTFDDVSINSFKESLKATLIEGDIINQIKTLNEPDDAGADAGAGAGGESIDGSDIPTIINPDEIPPKTCADVHGTPENPIQFNCEHGMTLFQSPENKLCLHSGCTELDCCKHIEDTCSLYSRRYLTYIIQSTSGVAVDEDQDEYSRLRSGIYKPVSSTLQRDDELLRSNNIVDNFNLSGIIPEEYIEYCIHNMYNLYEGNCAERIINIDTPAIVNCSEGRKNSDEYTSELRSLYQGSGLIDDYERQAVISCYEGGLDFGNGGCNVPDDGYYIIQQHERSGTNAIALKECSCPGGRPTSGSECPRAHSEFCESCNRGDPVVIGEGVSQISTCQPWYHRQPCNISDLVEPNNGSIDSSVTQIDSGNSVNIVCNEGYHLEGDAPVCQGGAPTGNFDYTEPICNPNVCTQPDPQTGYVFDGDTPCSNLQYGTENCNITCFDTSSGSPSFSCEGNGDPITLSGCPNVCDASGVRHIDRIESTVDAHLYGGRLYHEFTAAEKVFEGNCGNIGDYLLEGERCNITCPENKALISAIPVCGVDGTISNEMIQCGNISCRIDSVVQPSVGNNATLVSQLSEADAGDYDCTQPTREEGEVLYYTKSELETSLCIDSKCLDGSNYNPGPLGSYGASDLWSDEDGDGLSDWLEGWSWPCSQSSTCRNSDNDELADYQDKYSDEFWCTGNEETDATKLDTANSYDISIPRPCSNENDDWDNRRDPDSSTISWFYNHFDISMDDSVDDDSNIIKGSISPPPPPTLGNSCMIKCNDGYQYVEDTLQTCSEDGQEISGAEGRCELIPQEEFESGGDG